MKHTSKLKNGYRIWDIDAELRKLVKPCADEFGLSVEEFLDRFSREELPRQQMLGSELKIPKLSPREATIALAALNSDDKTLQRIVRAAKFIGKPVGDYIWEAIAGAVRCDEEEMIVSPKSGKAIIHRTVFDNFIVKEERRPNPKLLQQLRSAG